MTNELKFPTGVEFSAEIELTNDQQANWELIRLYLEGRITKDQFEKSLISPQWGELSEDERWTK